MPTRWLLSALLALEFMFRSDHEDGTLEQLVLSGQPLTGIALSKAAAHWTVSGLPLVITSPIVAGSLAVPAAALPALLISLVLGTGTCRSPCATIIPRAVRVTGSSATGAKSARTMESTMCPWSMTT